MSPTGEETEARRERNSSEDVSTDRVGFFWALLARGPNGTSATSPFAASVECPLHRTMLTACVLSCCKGSSGGCRDGARFTMAPARGPEWLPVCAQQNVAERMEGVGRLRPNSPILLHPAARAPSWEDSAEPGESSGRSRLPSEPRPCLPAQSPSLALLKSPS